MTIIEDDRGSTLADRSQFANIDLALVRLVEALLRRTTLDLSGWAYDAQHFGEQFMRGSILE